MVGHFVVPCLLIIVLLAFITYTPLGEPRHFCHWRNHSRGFRWFVFRWARGNDTSQGSSGSRRWRKFLWWQTKLFLWHLESVYYQFSEHGDTTQKTYFYHWKNPCRWCAFSWIVWTFRLCKVFWRCVSVWPTIEVLKKHQFRHVSCAPPSRTPCNYQTNMVEPKFRDCGAAFCTLFVRNQFRDQVAERNIITEMSRNLYNIISADSST